MFHVPEFPVTASDMTWRRGAESSTHIHGVEEHNTGPTPKRRGGEERDREGKRGEGSTGPTPVRREPSWELTL